MAEGVYRVTEQFEEMLARYTGAPYAVAVDNCSSALFLALTYVDIRGKEVEIPARTYPSVPCAIIHAGGKVRFRKIKGRYLRGAYQLKPTSVWDSALRFTHNMYIPGALMCLSFTGPYKHLKLGKAGAIITDDYDAFLWLKRARFSGRRECSYLNDSFDMLGWNFYLLPEIAARGIREITQFYDTTGKPKDNEDLKIPYPDLSKAQAYRETKQNEAILRNQDEK